MKIGNKIRLIVLICVFTPSIFVAQDAVKTNQDIEAIIQEYGGNEFSGSILVKSKDSIIHYSSYGYAQKEEGIKYTNNTYFSIGSIGKMVTSTIIMQLCEQNRIDLHKPLSQYLKNVPKDKQNITIHHLLTHTSGLPDFFTSGDDFKRVTKEEAYKQIMNLKLESSPGEKYAYSNSGYNLLAMIIEEVTDNDYLDHAINLFRQTGMTKSGFSGKTSWAKNEVARGYGFEKNGDNTPNSWPIPSWVIIGTGEVITSTADMLTWMDKLLSYQLVSKESLQSMFYKHIETGRPKNTFYGYGWKIRELEHNKTRIYHNGGGDFGQIATIRYYPHNDTKLIVLSNSYVSSPPKALLIAEKIEKNFILKGN